MNTQSQTHNRIKSLYLTFFGLMILLIATMALSFVDLGSAHTSVGLGIAVLKTLLVAIVFMNLAKSSNTTRLTSFAALLWLSFFILCVMGDYLTRGWDEPQQHTLRQGDHFTSYDRVEYSGTEKSATERDTETQ